MNYEEKHKHDCEISDRFISRSNYEDSELDDLSIQDFCVLINNAKYALNNHIFINGDERMKNLIEKFYSKLLYKVKNAESLYTIIDVNTSYPFIDSCSEDCIWIFSKEEYALDAIEHYKKEYRNFSVLEIENKNQLSLFHEIYLIGATGIFIDNGCASCIVKKEDLLEMPSYENTPMINIPITNPKLMLAHLKMVQELKWPVNYEKREENLNNLEKGLCDAINNAKFLLPVKDMPKGIDGSGKFVLEKDEQISIPFLKGKDGANGLPVFTDWKQFRMVYNDEKIGGLIVVYKELIEMVTRGDYSAIVMNVSRCPLEINNNTIKRLDEIMEKEDEKIESKEIVDSEGKEKENISMFSKLKRIFK